MQTTLNGGKVLFGKGKIMFEDLKALLEKNEEFADPGYLYKMLDKLSRDKLDRIAYLREGDQIKISWSYFEGHESEIIMKIKRKVKI